MSQPHHKLINKRRAVGMLFMVALICLSLPLLKWTGTAVEAQSIPSQSPSVIVYSCARLVRQLVPIGSTRAQRNCRPSQQHYFSQYTELQLLSVVKADVSMADLHPRPQSLWRFVYFRFSFFF